MIKRKIEDAIRAKIGKGKAIIVFGARQVGKTTLLKSIFPEDEKTRWFNGDDPSTVEIFDRIDSVTAATLVKNYTTVVIDEAQKIENIGLKLKILQDNFGDKVQFVATGSSSFDLANKINEPMTGRKWTFWLYPCSFEELANNSSPLEEKGQLSLRLVYGSYPDVVMNPADAEDIVKGLAGDNLYKDVLNLSEIIKTDRLAKILRALAFQVGSQVSINEIANLVGIDNKTVDKYIALLEQSFVIFRVPSFSRNLRKELAKSQKIYFYDVGIRNALVGDFRPVGARQDIGALFENYFVAEMYKKYDEPGYFWRTSAGQEIDYLVERNGELKAFEVKWNEQKKAQISHMFLETYNPKEALIVNKENFWEILG